MQIPNMGYAVAIDNNPNTNWKVDPLNKTRTVHITKCQRLLFPSVRASRCDRCNLPCSIQHLGVPHTVQHKQNSDSRVSLYHILSATEAAVKMTKELLQKGKLTEGKAPQTVFLGCKNTVRIGSIQVEHMMSYLSCLPLPTRSNI